MSDAAIQGPLATEGYQPMTCKQAERQCALANITVSDAD